MGINHEKSNAMVKRIKELRESKGLSHERLRLKLDEQYGYKISKGSLMNYEGNTGKAEGMSVETLRVLADFYEVSTDYLLGLTDTATPNVEKRAIVEATGLSEESVTYLMEIKNWDVFDTLEEQYPTVIDLLIKDARFENNKAHRHYRQILNLLYLFFSYKGSDDRIAVDKHGRFYTLAKKSYSISMNAIELNDTIIENALLAEMQEALMNLKHPGNKEMEG